MNKTKIKKLIAVLLTASLVFALTGCGAKEETLTATYLGIENYPKILRPAAFEPGAEIFRFEINGEEKMLAVESEDIFAEEEGNYDATRSYDQGALEILNHLWMGYEYEITVKDNAVTAATLLTPETPFTPVIPCEPGKKTLKNFLATAFSPMGTTLYVFGGNWDIQDSGSSPIAKTIGVSGTWVDFYNSQDASYNYKDTKDYEHCYYPIARINAYHYAGMDCSGYVGWTVYNTMETEDGQEGYGYSANYQAKLLANKHNLGHWLSIPLSGDKTEHYAKVAAELKPGDIVSIPGHIYIVIGKAKDGSILIIHSTMTNSSTGKTGGGVQMSAVNITDKPDKECDAYKLADSYNKKYFPEWAERYPAVVKQNDAYLIFSAEDTGIFHWDMKNILSDPEGYENMSAEEIMADLFGE